MPWEWWIRAGVVLVGLVDNCTELPCHFHGFNVGDLIKDTIQLYDRVKSGCTIQFSGKHHNMTICHFHKRLTSYTICSRWFHSLFFIVDTQYLGKWSNFTCAYFFQMGRLKKKHQLDMVWLGCRNLQTRKGPNMVPKSVGKQFSR